MKTRSSWLFVAVLPFLACNGDADPLVAVVEGDALVATDLRTDARDASLTDPGPLDVRQDTTSCVRTCDGRECGWDGCGGVCGYCPAAAPKCADGRCEAVECVPDCGGFECGDDGCGGSCGDCVQAAPRCVEHLCVP